MLFLLVDHIPFAAGAVIATVIFAVQAAGLAKAKYKKPLVFTRRAVRIYSVMWILTAILAAFAAIVSGVPDMTAVLAACAAFSPALLLVAEWILRPVEASINRGFYRDAERILRSMPDLKIIGITGSYGKTSTKHYLNRILSEAFDVTMTPGSFNTPLGVIRTIREYLKPYNEVFIVEMGAKQIGDIKEICDLVHPHMGIVTAVGEQHLESFKSIQNVQRTKFELVDALPADGLAVVNDDFEFAANRPVTNVACKRYAVKHTDNADYRATDIVYSPAGTEFTVTGDGTELKLRTKLVGECNISNLIAAVIVALKLGVPEDRIRYAVEKIEQVEHRLNLKRTPAGITIIDDAFNSNPTGSGMALDVLGAMPGGQRIVITPGMIELGDKQAEYNEAFGRHIASSADVAIVVGQYNRDAIIKGIAEGGMAADAVHTADTFAQAQQLLSTIVRRGDYVLYENDLPDTFK
jgi:UDP-N-acetylmuramoyl-tripeptide--D-alanyl-D-alanine ligase